MLEYEHFTETELITVLNEFIECLITRAVVFYSGHKKYNWVKVNSAKIIPNFPFMFW